MTEKRPSHQFLDSLRTKPIIMYRSMGGGALPIEGCTLLTYDAYNYIVSDKDGKKILYHKHAIESICEA